MQMYPAYTFSAVMNEIAVVFFMFLNEGYRLRYEAAIMASNIALSANMDTSQREKYLQQLEWAAKHPGDILDTDDEGDDPAAIKNLLG